ncbi:MAG TPA: hypothetical protein VE178_12805 [Silvibacterium sp.]|nr:hypothetical protein [Silvibacterium sp.]
MHPRASFVVALFGLGLLSGQAHTQITTPAQTQAPVQTAQQLVADVMYNELRDRECDSFWQYLSVRVSGSQDIVREQVETSEGPIFRILEDHNRPLDAEQSQKEEQRIQELVTKPGAMTRVEQDHLKDEERMHRVIAMLPQAFLYTYDGPSEGDTVRLSFRPNPAFTAPNYEARVVHALAGTLVVNQRLKRMVAMKGQMLDRVDFGYGLLGYVEKGSSFELQRRQVSETRWKTSLIDVHVQGKVLLLHNVTKDQREVRTDFHPVPQNISLPAAKELLDQAANTQTAVSLASTRP